MKYDPDQDINPETWLALDEQERIALVSDYHRRNKIRLPNRNIHATIHVIVENQLALGDKHPASAVLSRLISEGLDRHEAVHAIGSVLSEQLFNALKHKSAGIDLNAEYLEKLNRLTVESWRKQFS